MTNKRIIVIAAAIILLFLGIFTFANTGDNDNNNNNNNDNQNIIDENPDDEKDEGTNNEKEETTKPKRMSADTTAPVITLNGDIEVYIDLNTVYTELGAKVTDNKDDDKDATVSGNVDNTKAGIYTLTYTATDAAGNEATPVTRIIKVRPVISVLGTKFNHTMGEPYTPVKAGFSSDLNESSTLIDPTSNSVNPDKPGTYYLEYTGSANGVNATSKTITIVVVDEEDPVIDTVEKDPSKEWNNDDVKVTVNATDNDEVVEYSFDGGTTWQEDNFKTFTETTSLQIIVKDASGRTSTARNEEVKIDRDVPTITSNVTSSIQAGLYTRAEMLTFITAEDLISGIDEDSITYSGENEDYTFNTLGETAVLYVVKDNAGNETSLAIAFNVIDTEGPTCQIESSSTTEWSNQNVTITVSANDNYLMNENPYLFNSGFWWENWFEDWSNNNIRTYSSEGVRLINVTVRDSFLNENTCSVNVKIDKTDPDIDTDFYNNGHRKIVELNRLYTNEEMISFVEIDEDDSGLATVTYGGSSEGYTFTSLGNVSLQYIATDNAGNSDDRNVYFRVVEDATIPTITINPITYVRNPLEGPFQSATVSFDITVTDANGIDDMEYRWKRIGGIFGGTDWGNINGNPITRTFNSSHEGRSYQLCIWAEDNYGNENELCSPTFTIE